MADQRSASMAAPAAIVLDPADNVAVALRALTLEEQVTLGEISVTAREPIAAGHKLALRALAAGERVLKYGESIGVASSDIGAGEHVHVHNIRSARLPDPRR